jgi:hypothetical protein
MLEVKLVGFSVCFGTLKRLHYSSKYNCSSEGREISCRGDTSRSRGGGSIERTDKGTVERRGLMTYPWGAAARHSAMYSRSQ